MSARRRRRHRPPASRAQPGTPQRPAGELTEEQRRALHVLVSSSRPVPGHGDTPSRLGPPAEVNEGAAWDLVIAGLAHLASCAGEHPEFAAAARGRQALTATAAAPTQHGPADGGSVTTSHAAGRRQR